MDRKIRIYLASTKYDEEPGMSWKSRFIEELSKLSSKYEVFDPDPTNECDISMVPRDKAVIDDCDIFVAYMERPTVGTSMEIYHSYLKNDTPNILICPNQFCVGDIWIEAHVHCIVIDVEDAVKQIKTLRF